MKANIPQEIAALKRMTVTELRRKHLEAFGEPTGSGHKDYLVKRIAWRLQAQRQGGLSERARRRAEQLANDADLRTTAPKTAMDDSPAGVAAKAVTLPAFEHDPRIPLPGATLTRPYKGRDIVVTVRHKGFEYEGQIYRSLSAISKVVTGKHWNGYHFFKLPHPGKNGNADE